MDGVTVGTEVAVRRTTLASVAASCSDSHPLRSKDCRPHSKGSWRFSRLFKLGEPEGCPFELKNGSLFICKIGEIIASNSQDCCVHKIHGCDTFPAFLPRHLEASCLHPEQPPLDPLG